MFEVLQVALGSGEIAAFRAVGGARTVFLPDGIAARGVGSAVLYSSGTQKLDAKDRNGRVLAYATSLTRNVRTVFLGRVPTVENVYGLEAAVRFEVRGPAAIAQSLLLRGAEAWTIAEFDEQLGRRMQAILGRLACRVSPEALVGPARVEAEHELPVELSRVYDLEGLAVVQVCFQDVSQEVRRHELKLLYDGIIADAKAKGVPPESAFDEARTVIAEAAQAGDPRARGMDARLAHMASLRDLQAEAKVESAEVAAEAPRQRTVTEPVLMGAKHEAGGRFAVLCRNEHPRYFEMLRPWFFAGRDEGCHVQLAAAGVSSLHATFGRIGSSLFVVDHSSRNGTWFGGRRVTQRLLETGDVLRIGDFWIVFKLQPGQEFRPVDVSCRQAIGQAGGTLPRGAEADSGDSLPPPAETSGQVRMVSSAGRSAGTDSRPVLIGDDSACDLRLSGGGVGRFHAIVFWDVVLDRAGRVSDAGVFVEDLHSGRGTVLNGQPVLRAKLAHGDTLEIGGHRIVVDVTGNVRVRAEALYRERPATRGLSITCIEGPAAGATLILDPNKKTAVIGRAPDCDFVLPCTKVSSHHLDVLCELAPQPDGSYRPEFRLTDAGSTNGTVLNGRELARGELAKLAPGDLIRLGKDKDRCDLLVHHRS